MSGLKKLFKDVRRTSLRHGNIYADSWEVTTVDRTCWLAAVNKEMIQPFCKQTNSMEAKGCAGYGVRSPRHPQGLKGVGRGVLMLVLCVGTATGPQRFYLLPQR